MKRKVNAEKSRYWQNQVRRCEAYPGSLASYCRQAGIPPSSLSYWRRKLGLQAPEPTQTRSPFVAVQLERSGPKPTKRPPEVKASHLPDPRWVAQLILHLGKAGVQ